MMQFCEVQNTLGDKQAADITAADTTRRCLLEALLREALKPPADALGVAA